MGSCYCNPFTSIDNKIETMIYYPPISNLIFYKQLLNSPRSFLFDLESTSGHKISTICVNPLNNTNPSKCIV